MNNLSWAGDRSTAKKSTPSKSDPKKKKVDYNKEIDDLEKLHKRISEKYELSAHNKVSNAMVDIRCALENLKKFEY